MFLYDKSTQCLWIKAEIDPVAMGRPRFSRFKGRTKARTPTKSRIFKRSLRDIVQTQAWKAAMTPLDGPLAVFVHFVLRKPPSIKNSRDRPYPSVKPDLDNYAKAALDALNGVAWHDDGQVTSLNLQKHYAKPGEEPGIEIVVEPARWHMSRLEHRETILGRMVKPGGAEGVGLEINFGEGESRG